MARMNSNLLSSSCQLGHPAAFILPKRSAPSFGVVFLIVMVLGAAIVVLATSS